ncbi:MAG: acyl-CoA dehydrogenase family protein [Arthrobacter sp.]|uniref:acyl-CoA dehydrogenase family protein n=1 Tax=Arthrobacter sp. TaxID=1667 RepID=UPI0034917BC8
MSTVADTRRAPHAAAAGVAQESPATLGELRAAYRPLFERIRAGAVDRERRRELPFLVVEELKETGFTALRVPAEFGGGGASLNDVFELLLDLASADSNVAHLLRGHVAHVESLLLRAPDAHRDAWLRRIGAGALIGNAASERQEITGITTILQERGGLLTVSGTKYYTTGSIYADWISLSALRDGERHNVLVRADHPGVDVVDDWDGFGQQLTASGGLTLKDVPVRNDDVTAFDPDNPHAGFGVGVFQMVLLTVAAGIAQAAVEDAVDFVKPRRRTFAHPGELVPREEELVQAVVGEAAGKAHSARLIVAGQVAALAAYAERAGSGRRADGDTDADLQAAAGQLALDVFKSQQVVLKLALETATDVFEVGGASATSTALRLDRHWRNARTVASHNPAKYRARAVGEHLLTGRLRLWGDRGQPAATATAATANGSGA